MGRDAYWRWLLLGLGGLVRMIEEVAAETDNRPTPSQAKALAELSGRLAVVSGQFDSGTAKTRE